MAEIEIRALRKAFDGAEVLKGVDLTIEDGEFISLVGPSGCGKSTLLRIIAGLEPQSSGEIRIDGASADGIRPSARNLAMVFQSYALYPHLSVFDNIAVPLRMKRLSALERAPFVGRLMPGRRRAERVIRDDVERVAEQLEISPLLKRKPGQLSGGQRQRVAVGRAIVRQPRAFLFDEPLSNLDAKLRVHMRAEIAQLHRQLKTTFIYVTHDQAEAMTMSGRIAVMIAGELIQVGTPTAVYDDPCDIRVAEFVGTPKINAFPGRVRSDGRLEVLGHVLHVATPAPEGECRICVRPERIELVSHGLLSGTVVHLENLGSEAFVHIGSAGIDAPVVARVNDPGQLPAIGATVGYGFAPEAVRAFDVNGKRVATSVPSRVERPREMAVV
ncbi:ABC transporter ATP-binding protein [Bradyrhizobium sp. sBnM-33]|uniref:ABC transporter ATP-binding protein n=1 Tax=Bradyrhizobium sp. sBnM-33 TaxID=2831780 RepID=UPI001BD03A59|nr:ABC transporter ATP-binding protein [Bradyrhizobium sp. sBnM-33]WOH50722.1 ABC transporter ATP-binding protein [Bradyrhizobium sp. sBnM-33]